MDFKFFKDHFKDILKTLIGIWIVLKIDLWINEEQTLLPISLL